MRAFPRRLIAACLAAMLPIGIAPLARAAGMDITADELTRAPDGTVIARGDVTIDQRVFHEVRDLRMDGTDTIVARFTLSHVGLAGRGRHEQRMLIFSRVHGQWLITGDMPANDRTANKPRPHAAEEIRERVQAWNAAWNRRDRDALVALYAPETHPAEYASREAWLRALAQQFSRPPLRRLRADEVRYDPTHHRLVARGHVRITSPDGELEATVIDIDSETRLGSMRDVTIHLPEGGYVQAKRATRTSAHTIEAESVRFSMCPLDDQAWHLEARQLRLDDARGIVQARNASFHWLGITPLYTPWWRQAYKRQSGLLTPDIGNSQRRGTEFALPYYIAPAPDWDLTLTPRWMSARGLMGAIELRHVAPLGSEWIQLAGINDRRTARTRSRAQANIDWHLPADLRFKVDADHVSDHEYLADFSRAASTRPFLASRVSLSQSFAQGDWSLSAIHQQDLTKASDAAVAQVLPRLDSRLRLPLTSWLSLHLDQQTTRFQRKIQAEGWRFDLDPYLEIPWEAWDGGMYGLLRAGYRGTIYRLNRRDAVLPAAQRRFTHNNPYLSMEWHAGFERVYGDGQWRHALMPVVRYDWSDAPDQTNDPNFDSAFGRLTWSNLLSGNRFSGRDRIERANRISVLLESTLQHKQELGSREVLRTGLGASYNLSRRRIDRTLQKTPIRSVSNLLGSIDWQPWPGLTLAGEAQFDPYDRYLATGRISAGWRGNGHELYLAYQTTDARYAREARLWTARASLQLTPRWQLHGSWQYDRLLRLTQQATGGIRYRHACWNIDAEMFRYNRQSSTSGAADFGFHILLGFKGLGSVGS